jgi:hypothetical protein
MDTADVLLDGTKSVPAPDIAANAMEEAEQTTELRQAAAMRQTNIHRLELTSTCTALKCRCGALNTGEADGVRAPRASSLFEDQNER